MHKCNSVGCRGEEKLKQQRKNVSVSERYISGKITYVTHVAHRFTFLYDNESDTSTEA